jgi:hypothetical protein
MDSSKKPFHPGRDFTPREFVGTALVNADWQRWTAVTARSGHCHRGDVFLRRAISAGRYLRRL